MGLAVAAVAKATMMTLCQCTRVKRSTTQVAVAVAAVDGEDGVQWRRWGGTFDGRECGTMSGRDGGTTRVNAATIRHDETTRGRCNERTTRGGAVLQGMFVKFLAGGC